jgi:15,16-dihydrobiliverdin:ferredoxin oxidoreductase
MEQTVINSITKKNSLIDAHNLFDLMLFTEVSLLDKGFESQSIDPSFYRRDGKGEVLLESFHLKHPYGSEMRCSYLTGKKIEILNLMIYPINTDEVPVFAVEYILFNNKVFVAVLDLQPCSNSTNLMDRVIYELEKSFEFYRSSIKMEDEWPEWAKEHFTPVAIFTRQSLSNTVSLLKNAYQEYFQIWLELFFKFEKAADRSSDLRAYQKHHCINTPGRNYLSKTFGTGWTEEYLASFIYPA